MFKKEEIEKMTGPQLVEAYNKLASVPVKRFASLTEGRKRCAALLDEHDAPKRAAGLGVDEEILEQIITDSAQRAAGPSVEIAQSICAEEKKNPKGKKRGVVGFEMAYATASGKSVLQKGSLRRKIFEAVAAAGAAGTTVDALDEQFGMRTRPYLLKLRDQGHIR
jgi:hypothetical protein